MTEKHIDGRESKGIFYVELEAFAREKIRQHLQDLLEQEVIEWLGREKRQRKANPAEEPGVAQRLRQVQAVHVEPRDHRDTSAAGEEFG